MIKPLVFTETAPNVIQFLVGNYAAVNRDYATTLEHNLFVLNQYGINNDILYEINLRTRHRLVVTNGVILRSRENMLKKDVGRVRVFCAYQEFIVLTNFASTVAMIARNVTTTPKT